VLAIAFVLTPVTLLAGPHVTFAVFDTVALAGTASAWYFVLSRHVLRTRAAAVVGAAFCGFSPAMISHAAGHPNIAAQFLVPFLVLCVLRLREPGAVVAKGLTLAALVVVQAFLNEEILLLTALALGVVVVGYAAAGRGCRREIGRCVPDALKRLGITTLAAGVVLAYPLYFQFFGPQHYRSLPRHPDIPSFGADVASYWTFSRRALFGHTPAMNGLAQAPPEENTFFGWPLLILLVMILVWRWREPAVRLLALVAVVFAALSLGPQIRWAGQWTGSAGPFAWFNHLPLLDSVVPTRFALVLTPVTAILLAGAVDRLRLVGVRKRTIGLVLIGAALVPIVPTQLPAAQRPPIPLFFTSGAWQRVMPADAVVLIAPPGFAGALRAMQDQNEAGLGFAIMDGYCLTPDPTSADHRPRMEPVLSATAQKLTDVAKTGRVPVATAQMGSQAVADVHRIGLTTVVLPVREHNAEALRATLDQLLGAGRRVTDVWVWDVRAL
jgi:hypothetical protein